MISEQQISEVLNGLVKTDQAKYHWEKKQIKQALGQDLYSLMKDLKMILAGGALTSLFTGKEVNDYDLYFTDEDSVGVLISEIYGHSAYDYLQSYQVKLNFMTEKSLLLKSETDAKVQFIHYKMYKDAQDIFDSFDYTINMVAFDFAKEEFAFHPEFWHHLSNRSLHFNPRTLFPVVSLMRVDKYKQRGYTISKSEMLRIAFTIADKQYCSWEEILSEVGGLYGVKVEDVFDTTKEFSLQEAIQQLEGVNMKESFESGGSYSFSDVIKNVDHCTSQHFKDWLKTSKSETDWGTERYSSEYSHHKYD